MQSEKVSISMPKMLIIKSGQPGSTMVDNQFFDKAFDLIKESPFIGQVNQDEFWDYAIYQDFSTFETEKEMDIAYDVVLKKYRPDISLLFGCNLYEGHDVNWAEFQTYKIRYGFKRFKSEYYHRYIDGSHIYQINLQNPLSPKYNFKAMYRLLYKFGSDYYEKFIPDQKKLKHFYE